VAITADDLRDFIREKWGERVECPRCHTFVWNIGQSDNLKGTFPVSEDGSGYVLGPRHLPFYWAACDNCGYMEMIASVVVRSWLERRNRGEK
jgi:hypothetical protein